MNPLAHTKEVGSFKCICVGLQFNQHPTFRVAVLNLKGVLPKHNLFTFT